MKKIKNATLKTTKFVSKHRFAIGVATGLSAGLALNARNQGIINEFLEEKGLLDEFYFIPES